MSSKMLTLIEVHLCRGLHHARQIAGLLPLAAFCAACGGSSTVDSPNDKGVVEAGGQANPGGGAGGSGAASGFAGSGGTTSAGASGEAGGGAGSAASGGMAGGSGGMAGESGGGGMGLAGSAGNSAVCHAQPPQPCGGGTITLARSCVTDAMAAVGTSLPLQTCRTMCETMFTFSCTVSAVQQTSITVQCSTGCPASQP
ncbi:MAG TPA: hypothetical protein VHM25_26755 [Polyangiaceae bacterium]|nr:hypothetical protein [Polyangiaceae bacterium]